MQSKILITNADITLIMNAELDFDHEREKDLLIYEILAYHHPRGRFLDVWKTCESPLKMKASLYAKDIWMRKLLDACTFPLLLLLMIFWLIFLALWRPLFTVVGEENLLNEYLFYSFNLIGLHDHETYHQCYVIRLHVIEWTISFKYLEAFNWFFILTWHATSLTQVAWFYWSGLTWRPPCHLTHGMYLELTERAYFFGEQLNGLAQRIWTLI